MICKTNFKYDTTPNITWNNLRVFSSKPEELQRDNSVPEIQELTHKLAKIAHVKRVVAIAPKFPDIHWVDFELELHPQTELSDEVWYQLQDLVIDYEWRLRDKSAEKWYFNAEPVSKLSKLQNTDEIIADSQTKDYARPTWSSPPFNFSKSQSFL
jgi:hypothetical protein